MKAEGHRVYADGLWQRRALQTELSGKSQETNQVSNTTGKLQCFKKLYLTGGEGSQQ